MKFSLKTLSLLSLSLIVGLTACSRRQAMYKQEKYLPYGKSEFFSDGREMRPLVAGTVAHGPEDEHLTKALVNGQPATTYPFPIGRAELERGMNRYTVFCTPCHSRTGDGWGMVVQRGFKRPPSLHEERLRVAPVSHFFNVITNGMGQMSGYSTQIPAADRWMIIAYVRALQQSQSARITDVPDAERAELEAMK